MQTQPEETAAAVGSKLKANQKLVSNLERLTVEESGVTVTTVIKCLD